MKVKVIYGSPCAGKTTLVQRTMGPHDIVYDYDALIQAITNKNMRDTNKHVAHDVVRSLRKAIFNEALTGSGVETMYIISSWPTDSVRTMLNGFDVQYYLVDSTEAECLKRLEGDKNRPDKEAWARIIRTWFQVHASDIIRKEARGMKEIRTCEIRAAATVEAGGLLIQGTPIVYEKPATIQGPAGPFTEIIRRGALDDADVSDVRLMYNHDPNKVPLARTPKTMQLNVTPAGMEIEATLPDTEAARSVHTAVARGDLTGMSFAFKVPKGGDRYDLATRTREIFKIEKVLECSIVPFPAYPQASVEARAAMSSFHSEDRKRIIIAANMIMMKEV